MKWSWSVFFFWILKNVVGRAEVSQVVEMNLTNWSLSQRSECKTSSAWYLRQPMANDTGEVCRESSHHHHRVRIPNYYFFQLSIIDLFHDTSLHTQSFKSSKLLTILKSTISVKWVCWCVVGFFVISGISCANSSRESPIIKIIPSVHVFTNGSIVY